MKILFLAPQPFYQERGTPIAVRLALETLSSRLREVFKDKFEIDLLTFPEGTDVQIPDVKITRIKTPKWLQGIKPGISTKKIFCDAIFAFSVFRFIFKAGPRTISLIHAVEESVFIALAAKLIFGIPYIYDMDSSLALQLTERWWLLKPMLPILRSIERIAIKNSVAVAPVCDALEAIALQNGSKHTVMLRDVSLLGEAEDSVNLRREAGIDEASKVILYVGNLESYQGVDLLVSAFERANGNKDAHLVIIGGLAPDVSRLKYRTSKSKNIHILGPRPVSQLASYLANANILASPRTLGNNTPMKIYSYLHAGRAILATALPTHTQVLDPSVSCLVEPTVEAMAEGIELLINDDELCERLGKMAYERASREYTPDAFRRQLCELYDRATGGFASVTVSTAAAAGKTA